jgi:cardiolipin synthase (CMP-forming)
LNIPNALTALRLALTPFVVWRFLAGDCRGAFTLLLIAGFSDAIDGFVARRWNQVTRTGAYLDPIADKLLLVSVYVSLGIVNVVPRWLVWLVVGRDFLILSMAGIGLLFTSQRNYPPSVWGKLSTAIQISTALVAVVGCVAGYPLPEFLVWLTAAATAWSGLHYLLRGIRLLAVD